MCLCHTDTRLYRLINWCKFDIDQPSFKHSIAPEKRSIRTFFSYFSLKTYFVRNSLEGPRIDPSNEYIQHMLLWENKKNNISVLKKASYLVL